MDDPTGYRGGGSARMDQDPAEFPTDRNHRINMDRGYGRSDRYLSKQNKMIFFLILTTFWAAEDFDFWQKFWIFRKIQLLEKCNFCKLLDF